MPGEQAGIENSGVSPFFGAREQRSVDVQLVERIHARDKKVHRVSFPVMLRAFKTRYEHRNMRGEVARNASSFTLSQKQQSLPGGPDGPSLSRPHAMLVAHGEGPIGQWPPGDHGQAAPVISADSELPGSPSLGSILRSS